MAAQWTDAGLQSALSQMELDQGGYTFQAQLFTNDVTPTFTSVPGDFAVPTGSQYAPQEYNSALWGESLDGIIRRASATFKFDTGDSGGNNTTTLFGFFCYFVDNDQVCYAQRFPFPIVLMDGSTTIPLTLNLSCRQLP